MQTPKVTLKKTIKATMPVAKMRNMAVKTPVKPDMAGTSPQREAYGKAMKSAFKNTKTFGMPGK